MHYSEGIGYGEGTQAVFYTQKPDGKRLSNLPDATYNISQSVWWPWGEDNLLPVELAEDIENCGVLSAGIISKVRMAIGKGIEPFLLTSVAADGTETLEHVIDSEIQGWLELNNSYLYSYKNIYNMLGYGWSSSQMMLSKDRKSINRILAPDIWTARLEKRNESSGFIENMYLCSNWEGKANYDPQLMKRIPVLQEGYELSDLKERPTGFEFAVLHRMLINGRGYYPRAMWLAAREWVKISRSVPAMKNAINKNQMSIKYVIIIAESYWERMYPKWKTMTDASEKEKIVKKKYKEIDNWLSGEKAAGKSIIAGSYIDPYTQQAVKDIEINVIEDQWKDGKMLPDNAAADKQILFSMFFNPAIWGGNLLGDGASGGAGSGSDIREAYLVHLMLMQLERNMNLQIFNLVKYYNNWTRVEKPDKILVFRYKTDILTTLDTGGSTKPKIAS